MNTHRKVIDNSVINSSLLLKMVEEKYSVKCASMEATGNGNHWENRLTEMKLA